MKKIKVTVGSHHYPIIIAPGILSVSQVVAPLLQKSQRVVIVTNKVLEPLYLAPICAHLAKFELRVTTLVLPDGERYKTLTTLEYIINQLLEQQHNRDTTLLALGGGVIHDLVGFAAACYQRGIAFIPLPTTLLAQVDAAIGGKTGINHPLGKNMVGVFHQPEAVLIDPHYLNTLPIRQLYAGLAEVMKYGMVLSAELFIWLETHIEDLQQRQMPSLVEMISRCCALKAEVIARDEREKNLRLLLNFGHTVGHAIETYMGYSHWLHGEAVAVGMVVETAIAVLLGLCSDEDLARLKALLLRAKLPITVPLDMSLDACWPYLMRDKKVHQQQLRFILPTAIGKGVVQTVDYVTISTAIEQCRSHATRFSIA